MPDENSLLNKPKKVKVHKVKMYGQLVLVLYVDPHKLKDRFRQTQCILNIKSYTGVLHWTVNRVSGFR